MTQTHHLLPWIRVSLAVLLFFTRFLMPIQPAMAQVPVYQYEVSNYAPYLNGPASFRLEALVDDPTDNPGTLIAEIVASGGAGAVVDPDLPDTLPSIAVTGADNTQGLWQYSLNGSDWINLGSPSHSAARLLASDAVTRLRFVPGTPFNGTAWITFRAWDRYSGENGGLADVTTNGGETAFSTAVAAATITIHLVNLAPVLSPIGDQAIQEDTYIGALPLTIGDTDSPVDTLTFTGVSSNTALIRSGNILFNGTGAERSAALIPEPNQHGTSVITITVSDGELTASQSFTLTVEPVNDAPSLFPIGSQTVTTGKTVNFQAGAEDIDGDTLTFSTGSDAPAGASIDPDSGVFTWTAGVPGTYLITIWVRDEGTLALADSMPVSIIVKRAQVFIPLIKR